MQGSGARLLGRANLAVPAQAPRAYLRSQAVIWATDKRKFPRVVPHETKPVQVHLMGTNFLEVLTAADISEGGIGIRVSHSFEGYDMDRQVEVVVSLPGAKAFMARGRLRSKSVRENTHVFGVQFTYVADEGKELLSEYVTRMLLLGRGC
jgi:hypothetical protein